MTGEIARSLGLPIPQGALVADVWPGGAAQRAGLRQAIVTTIDGQTVVDAAGLNYAIGTHRPGDSIRLGACRANGKAETLTLRAEAAPTARPATSGT